MRLSTNSQARRVGLVVVAAGSARRFGFDKLRVILGGQTVLERAISCLRQAFPQASMAVVVKSEEVAFWQARFPSCRVVAGGEQRQDSVQRGVQALGLAGDDLVLIHDGARPFVPKKDVEAVAEAALQWGAAVLTAPVVDTLKEVEETRVVRTWPREKLVRSLTPQAFQVGLLCQAWALAEGSQWTDEAALLERLGKEVVAVPGDPRNLKLTRPEDLSLLAGLFPATVRVGQGVDVHPFASGRKLFLCGVEIPSPWGLAGHSDADVALHAVTDALLGACGAGDIGVHFPPTDSRWKDASSHTFVAFALEQVQARGLRVAHCDLTVLAEKPRLAPHREAMVSRLAELLGVERSCVNLKATTCEGLGFVGREEGVVAMAVVTLVSI